MIRRFRVLNVCVKAARFSMCPQQWRDREYADAPSVFDEPGRSQNRSQLRAIFRQENVSQKQLVADALQMG
jgi:hypothetical protein